MAWAVSYVVQKVLSSLRYVLCDKMQDEPSRVTDRGAGGTSLTKGRVKGEGVVDCKVK